ncbi:MAG: hypothetical protein COA78_09950 [Blastopirellula sp.]|nr:MAG: hypothetical protein COA78_09950 [Blastopirellula sp.]
MDAEVIRAIFGWSSLISIGFLFYWFIMIVFAHDFVYQIHSKWFKISVETFDAIHYGGMAFFKLSIFLFQLAPYLAMRIVF